VIFGGEKARIIPHQLKRSFVAQQEIDKFIFNILLRRLCCCFALKLLAGWRDVIPILGRDQLESL
jgi:hypothetical protein